eukprot:1157258-Pelagomonas_calceolata.AAC.5
MGGRVDPFIMTAHCVMCMQGMVVWGAAWTVTAACTSTHAMITTHMAMRTAGGYRCAVFHALELSATNDNERDAKCSRCDVCQNGKLIPEEAPLKLSVRRLGLADIAGASVQYDAREKCAAWCEQEENAKLRVEVAQLEAAVKEKGSLVNLTENKLAASEAHAKIALAESQPVVAARGPTLLQMLLGQALAMKEAAALRRELEDAQQALERIRSHYAESESEKNKEVARIKVGREYNQ